MPSRVNFISILLNSSSVDEAALKWFRKAADNERPSKAAMYNLAIIYLNGTVVEQSNETAVRWIRKAAEQGEADAQNNLGSMYYEGEWILLADAQNNLGAMYYDGNGIEQSNETAVKWINKAAEQGYVIASKNLAAMYFDGKGVEQSYETAVKWCHKAAELGDEGSQKLLAIFKKNGLLKE